MAIQQFQFELTCRDKDVLRTIRTVLTLEGQTTFCADDLYLLGLDRFYEDPVHGVGGFFARCQHAKLIRPCGSKRSTRESNHLRLIKLYEFVEGSK